MAEKPKSTVMFRRAIIFILLEFFISGSALAQKPEKQQPAIDSLFTDYDVLFSELDAFLDSILAPRNFALINIGVTPGYFTEESKESYLLKTSRKLIYSPSISYFFKSGIGMSAGATIVNDGQKLNPFQYSATLSYDYIKNKKFITGIGFSHFFTKDSLPFYTSPLQNGALAYFTYRNFWVKPTLALSYGWGTRSEYSEREEYITSIRLRPRGYTRINTTESINDLSLTASVRHDFYWLNVFSHSDFIRLTPQVSFVSGTQKFGFNQTSNTYATRRLGGANLLYNSENVYLDDQLYFQPLSLTGFIKTEYSRGRFFIQPQVMFDYYFPATAHNFSTAFVVNAGIIL
jgi:hypothetical protein